MGTLTERWKLEQGAGNGRWEDNISNPHKIVTETLCFVIETLDKEIAEMMIRDHNHCLIQASCPECKSLEVMADYGREFQDGDDNPSMASPMCCGNCGHAWEVK